VRHGAGGGRTLFLERGLSKGSDTEATELRQEFEARLAELATHGVQADEHSGSPVFARALVKRK
jgi:hypothetical protein